MKVDLLPRVEALKLTRKLTFWVVPVVLVSAAIELNSVLEKTSVAKAGTRHLVQIVVGLLQPHFGDYSYFVVQLLFALLFAVCGLGAHLQYKAELRKLKH